MPEARVIRPKPGDMVVWKCDNPRLTQQDLARVAEQVRQMFPHNEVLVLSHDEDLRTMSDVDLEEIGLTRIRQPNRLRR